MNPKRLARYRERLYRKPSLIGRWLWHKVAEALMADGSAEAVQVLAEAATHKYNERFLVGMLQQMAEDHNIEAQEALCRLVIRHDHSIAREAALKTQCAPRDVQQRALFYFLTGQWEKYESLDFDHSFLRAAYELGDEQLIRRIAEQARQAGRVEWVEVITGGREKRRLEEMTDDEWNGALPILFANQRWEELWRLAQDAPPNWSAKILQGMNGSGWTPRKEADEYDQLAQLAMLWKEPIGSSCITCQAILEGHKHSINSIVISPDGRLLVSGSFRELRLWSLPEGKLIKKQEGHKSYITSLAISPDGRLLMSGGKDCTVRLWNLPHGTLIKTLNTQEKKQSYFSKDQFPSLLAVSPDGKLLVSISQDNTIRLWELPGARLIKKLKMGLKEGMRFISPDGKLLATANSDGHHEAVRLWSLPDGSLVNLLKNHRGEVNRLAFSHDSRLLVSSTTENTVQLWSIPDGNLIKTLEGDLGRIECLAISPGGKLLAIGSFEWGSDANCFDWPVRLFDLPDGKPLEILRGNKTVLNLIAISPDERLLVTVGYEKIYLWSNLYRLSRLPIGNARVIDFKRVEAMLDGEKITEAERRALEFIALLMRRRLRFDIIVEAPRQRIEAGEFDIEIEG
jgi:WD40 repeat protein